MGQSGSGKSTIARLVTGVERPDQGEVVLRRPRVDKLRAAGCVRYLVTSSTSSRTRSRRSTPPDRSATPHPPAGQLPGLSRGEAPPAGAGAAGDASGFRRRERFVDKYPHQLSGGQRQRVVVARALAPEPEIIIADEPISMLDVSIRAEILQLLDKLVRDRRIAMLYITHDLLSARLLADEILVLHRGELVERGPAVQVIRAARDDYTRLLLDAIPNPFGR